MLKKKIFLFLMLFLLLEPFTYKANDNAAEIETLKKEIAQKSEEIKNNNKEIINLETQIEQNEQKKVQIATEIEILKSSITRDEEFIEKSLSFTQKIMNKKSWLDVLGNNNLLLYIYNFKKITTYINDDFKKLRQNIETLTQQQVEYTITVDSLEKSKITLEEENEATNEIYKDLNEELIELESELEYTIEYDETAYIDEEDQKELMSSAGISEEDFTYADYIIGHESSWNYKVANPYSSAYGLCQSLPGEKMAQAGNDWQTNPLTQLIWCNGYAETRYGSWADAQAFWIENQWW